MRSMMKLQMVLGIGLGLILGAWAATSLRVAAPCRAATPCNDPGEAPQKGGLLVASYGQGYYIYNGYAFFRQLPFGVPGAIRLYVNLLSVGHESK